MEIIAVNSSIAIKHAKYEIRMRYERYSSASTAAVPNDLGDAAPEIGFGRQCLKTFDGLYNRLARTIQNWIFTCLLSNGQIPKQRTVRARFLHYTVSQKNIHVTNPHHACF